MSLKNLADKLYPVFLKNFSTNEKVCRVFLAATDMKIRAIVRNASANTAEEAWKIAFEDLQKTLSEQKIDPIILRADWVTSSEKMTWSDFQKLVKNTRRNYFRRGLALDSDYKFAFTEMEMNGYSMLYLGGKEGGAKGVFRQKFSDKYCQRRYGCDFPTPADENIVEVFDSHGAVVYKDEEPAIITGSGINAGRRDASPIDQELFMKLAKTGANYLAGQVQKSGKFVYGYHTFFHKSIPTYNTLRHISSVFAMLDVYGAYKKMAPMKLGKAIVNAMEYAVKNFVKYRTLEDGTQVAYVEDSITKEIKLGANGVSLLALVKYSDLMHTKKYLPVMKALAKGILTMQKPDGSFVHVLNSEDFSLKEPFRIVYYDGEAVFGMLRLYSITKDESLLKACELAFERFIKTNHWQNHDHWLSYAVNEMTLYKPEAKYFEFGINNFLSFLPFIYHRDTQFPTLLELMMAADTMLERMKNMPEMSGLLKRVNLDDFYASMEKRAENLLNGHFWPELAMYFANPQAIVGSFFIRHHAFRVRIDDVEHFLSGFVAYCRYLERRKNLPAPVPSQELLNGKAVGTGLFNIQSNEVQSAEVKQLEESKKKSVVEKIPTEKVIETELPKKVPTEKVTETELPKKIPTEKVIENKAVIFYGGDVNIGRRMHFRIREVEQFVGIDEMAQADLRIVNLECVIATKGEQGIEKGEGGPYYYRARPEQISILTKAGIDVVLTANNHAGDYGNEALLEERKYLDEAGILYTGSGKNFAEAIRPVYKTVNNITVAIFSADSTMKYFASDIDNPGTAFLSLKQPKLWKSIFEDKIKLAHEKADIVIVAPHWGINQTNETSENMKTIGHLLIDLGADAVLGCHSHLVHGVENYKNRPIVYDAGDFLFDSKLKPKSGGCFTLEISDFGVEKVKFIPLKIDYGQSVKMTGSEAEVINKDFVELCNKFKTETFMTDSGDVEIKFNPPPREKIKKSVVAEEENIHVLRKEWTAEKVPDDAKITPQNFGPINLIGCKVSPLEMKQREMIFVETYWTVDKPTDKNCRIDITGVPQRLCFMPKFGLSMEHEGCDWMYPTNLWQPGIIYYERFGLRPPELKQMINCDLRVEIKVQADNEKFGSYVDKTLIKLRLPNVVYYENEFPDSIYKCETGKTWNAKQLADVTGGVWIVEPPKDWFVNSLAQVKKRIDLVNPPTLFVAETRTHHNFHANMPDQVWNDTHKILHEIQNKVVGAIVERPVDNLPADFPQLLVKDSTKSLIELGLAARKRFHGKVIAVTGTAGKSSVVNMLKQALKNKKCIASYDNFNSKIGVPASLANLPQDADYAIIEIAQSALWMKRGPITVDINPDISIITQIGLSQTNIKSLKTIKDAATYKTRIFMGLTEHGTAIFHDKLECFDYVKQRAEKFAENQIICGSSDNATSKILEVKDTAEGHDVRAIIEGEEVNFSVSPHGSASIFNTMLVLSAVKALGENLSVAIENLKDYKSLGSRLEHFDINWKNKKIRLIDDSWNATVLSFKRALEAAPFMKTDGRLIGVLGRIVNLGDMAEKLHKSLKDDVLNANFSLIITHGDEMKYLREVLPKEKLGPHFSDAQTLTAYLATIIKDNDTVLLKGSRRDSDFGDISSIMTGEK